MDSKGKVELLLDMSCKLVFLLEIALIFSISTIDGNGSQQSNGFAPVIDYSPRINYTSGTYQLNVSISDVKELNIPTYDGSGQCVHPSVKYVPGGWAGYEWWMAFTPYQHCYDTYENPSLVASHDGIKWVVPKGLTNPIDPTPKKGHNADTELVYDGKNMLVYYVEIVKSHIIACHRRIVYANMSIGTEENCTNFYPISPAIIRKSGNDWIAWYCDLGSLQLYSATSKNGLDWTNQTIVPTNMPKLVSWHISALQIDNGYSFLIAAFSRVKDDNSHTKLYLGEASNSKSIIKMAPILSPRAGWTGQEIYRSCMVGSRVYISARDTSNNWHIGYGTIASELTASNSTIWEPLSEGFLFPHDANLSSYENVNLSRSLHKRP
jgi:hypothetical protein